VSTASWPEASTAAQFGAVRRDEARLRPPVLALCGRLGLAGEQVARFPGGSLPVYAVGDRLVLKLYPPAHRACRTAEERVLRVLGGGLPVPTPRVEQSGESGSWGYILMTRLHGEPLTGVWPRTSERDRDRLAAQLGRALAGLHEVSIPALGPADWARFISAQRAGCAARQRALGLGEPWLAQIPDFLDSVRPAASAPVLLHTEVMREHLLAVRGAGGQWSLSGLYDFEPAMMGAREYEFALAGVYVSAGDPLVLRRLLTAYGYRDDELDGGLQRRLLAYALLHRYSNLPKYLRILPRPPAQTLGALAECWWRLG
jgi:hygromycin-B 7''-O-kinase